jgi:HD-GYP domain-containing protein (c-di-GMP phosphodiesterase class II)
MASRFPPSVIDKILRISLEHQAFAYLALDDEGVLQTCGGELKNLGLPEVLPGENILDQVPFLVGLVPLLDSYQVIEAMAMEDDILVDAHLFREGSLSWVILVDRTEQMEWQSRARQKGNELRLLREQMERAGSSKESGFEFFEALNLMALLQSGEDEFVLLKPVAEVFRQIYPEPFESSNCLKPQTKFPFLENFLIDAKEVWNSESQNQRVYSGPWIEADVNAADIALEALAVRWKEHNLLFIAILDEHYQQHHEFLQIGREGMLLKNILAQEVRKRTRDIRDREEEIALRLVSAADSRDDGETGAHIRRLGLYSALMAKHLDWSEEQIDEIRIAAPMHDIGKIGIPDRILKKPGRLTSEEFEVMKTHAEIGARILSNSQSSLVQMAREIALGHHEKWEGSGYPSGLVGDEIPISARIVAIVDVFDALIHKRVYKDAMDVQQALDIMREGRGSHFDPDLFDLFIELRDDMVRISQDFFDPRKVGVASPTTP